MDRRLLEIARLLSGSISVEQYAITVQIDEQCPQTAEKDPMPERGLVRNV